jgi:hypothetical protein
MSIPASTIVSVVPSVLAAGGNPLALNGLFISANVNLPVVSTHAPISFPNLASVQAYFGQYSCSFSATCAGNVLTVTAVASGTLAVGQEIQSTLAVGVPPGTYILSLGTGTGGTGTYNISGAGFTQAAVSPMTSNCLESQMAAVYFNGFTASTTKPTALLMSRYVAPGASTSASILGANAFLRGYTSLIANWQTVSSGTLTLTVNGVQLTSSALNLSAAGTGSAAAALIQAGFTLSGATLGLVVSYSSQFNAFVFQTATNATITTCAATNISAATGAPANALGLTAAQATISIGASVDGPAVFMPAVALATTNWACYTTCFEPSASDKLLHATWTSSTGSQFVYVPYDSDTTIVSSATSTTCISAVCKLNSLYGTCAVYQDSNAAAFVLGFVASLNYNATNGRAAISYKSGTNITPSVTDPTSFANAVANGTNFYGQWATANSLFTFFWNGAISGPFGWLDSYVSAIWLNNALQLALVNMFTSINSVPYNNAGYATIKSGCKSTLDQGLLNGTINRGVALTSSQANSVDTAAGLIIDPVLATAGYYLQVLPATPTQRNNRQSPTCTLWYMDGGSVNQLNLASINIQ